MCISTYNSHQSWTTKLQDRSPCIADGLHTVLRPVLAAVAVVAAPLQKATDPTKPRCLEQQDPLHADPLVPKENMAQHQKTTNKKTTRGGGNNKFLVKIRSLLGNPFTYPCWGSYDFLVWIKSFARIFKIFQGSLVFQTYKFQMFYWCADFKYGWNRETKWNMLGWYRGGLVDFIAASYWNWRTQLDVNRGIEMRNQEISRSNPINFHCTSW